MRPLAFSPSNRQPHTPRRHLFAGTVLIVLGIVLALADKEWLRIHSSWDIVPALIALSGILRIVTARRSYAVGKGGLHIAFAAWLYLCLERLWGWNFHDSWPVVLILLGAGALLRGLCHRGKTIRQGEQP